MNKRIIQFGFVLLSLLASSGSAQIGTRFTEVKSQTEDPLRFEFISNGNKFKISENGHGRSVSGSRAAEFSLLLEKDEILQGSVYFAEFQNDILLIAESYLNDGGAGFLARMDGQTLKVKWKRHIPAFNIGPGLLHGNYAYVTAIGFVGKIDLRNGSYAWSHDDLYGQQSSSFNSFEQPNIVGTKVVFRESEHYLRKSRAFLEVDIRTGKILRKVISD